MLACALTLLLASPMARAQSADELKVELDHAFDGRIGMPAPMRESLRSGGPLVIPRPYTFDPVSGELVDLHAHLFMEHGLGILFTGRFDGPIRAGDWSDRFSSQANPQTLEASELGLVVAALYAHPILAANQRGAIRAQILEARGFVAGHPDWSLAYSAGQAREARKAGKKVLVLSLEGAAGVLESERDLEEFIDRGGIRIVTLAHITDDGLTGAAMLGGYRNLGNPQGYAGALAHKRGLYGELLNPNGLTDKGRWLVRELLKRGVWIDLSHAPDAAQAELVPMVLAAGQPLLYTHTHLRRYAKNERGISDKQLAAVAAAGGIVGLAPAADALEGTVVPEDKCFYGCRCEGDVYALAVQYEDVARAVGPANTFIGSDFNGAEIHLKPSGCSTGTSLDGPGLSDIGQTADLWSALGRVGAPVQATGTRGLDRFLDVWSRVRP